MKHLLFIFLLVAGTTVNTQAQDDAVKNIRRIYYETAAKIEAQQKGNAEYGEYKLTVNRSLPGTGPQEQNLHFFFEIIQNEAAISHKLLQVNRNYNISNRYRVYEEFLFDETQLIFYFEQVSGDECGEIRMYFEDERAVKIVPKQVKGCDEESQMYLENDVNSRVNYTDKLYGLHKQTQKIYTLFEDIQNLILN